MNWGIGDACAVAKPKRIIGGGIVERLIPATIVSVTDYGIGVCYSDGEREMVEPAYIRKPRP